MLRPTPDAVTTSAATSESGRRLRVELGFDGEVHLAGGNPIKFSPDGSMVGFVAVARDSSGDAQIFLRRLDQLEAGPIPGAMPADQFCFSPDGQWIAFRDYREGWIKKVKLTGGPVSKLCQADDSVGIDWVKISGAPPVDETNRKPPAAEPKTMAPLSPQSMPTEASA